MVAKKDEEKEACPRCGAALGVIVATSSGKKVQRCSAGQWNPTLKKVEGCAFARWFPAEPIPLKEKCPKCGSDTFLVTTRTGKRLKRCSTNKWNVQERKAEGCDFVAWV
ncbi:hypothetical protein HY214_02860 [Candidatus Roizmanbacteria bacterium]|nr:hypothetical protein [Candidatus Roizmanbacteria bacterium]